jgi:hypothetical protein
MPHRLFPLPRCLAGLLAALLLSGTLAACTPPQPQAAAPTSALPAETATLAPAAILASSATPAPTPAATATPLPAETAVLKELPAEVRAASALAGWPVLTPARLPKDYTFQSAYFDSNHAMLILTYIATRPLPGDATLTATKTITLAQALKNDAPPLLVSPGMKAEALQVNGQAGTYGLGAWDSEFVADAQDPNGGKMAYTWRPDLPIQNLYWQVGPVFLVLVTDDESLARQDLVDMAASVGQ